MYNTFKKELTHSFRKYLRNLVRNSWRDHFCQLNVGHTLNVGLNVIYIIRKNTFNELFFNIFQLCCELVNQCPADK